MDFWVWVNFGVWMNFGMGFWGLGEFWDGFFGFWVNFGVPPPPIFSPLGRDRLRWGRGLPGSQKIPASDAGLGGTPKFGDPQNPGHPKNSPKFPLNPPKNPLNPPKSLQPPQNPFKSPQNSFPSNKIFFPPPESSEIFGAPQKNREFWGAIALLILFFVGPTRALPL